MNSPPTTDVAAAVRHLSASLPYTRLFGAHFSFAADTGSICGVDRRKRELETSGRQT